MITKGHFTTLHHLDVNKKEAKQSALQGASYLGDGRDDAVVPLGPITILQENTWEEVVKEIARNSDNYAVVNIPNKREIIGVDREIEINPKKELLKEQYQLFTLIKRNQNNVVLPSELYQASTILRSKTHTPEQVIYSLELAEKGLNKFIYDKNYPEKFKAELTIIRNQIIKARKEFVDNVNVSQYSTVPNENTERFLNDLEQRINYIDNTEAPEMTKWYKPKIESIEEINKKKLASVSNINKLEQTQGGLREEEIKEILTEEAIEAPLQKIFPPDNV